MQRFFCAVLLVFNSGTVFPGQPGDAGTVDGCNIAVLQRTGQCVLQCGVRKHVAKLGNAQFGGTQHGTAETLSLRNVDGAYCRDIVQRVPYAETLQQQSAAIGQGQRAGILTGGIRRTRFQHADLQLACAQRQCQRCADRPASDNDYIELQVHDFLISSSISATFFGAVAVNTSLPLAVISTSSSIRMPMFHNASGTSSAGRM